MSKHLQFLLVDYVKESYEYLLEEQFKINKNTNFELFMVLFESPFKIKLSFFNNKEVARTFFDYIFKYLEELNNLANTKAKTDENAKEWILCSLNVSIHPLKNCREK